MRFPPSFLEEIKARLPVSDVVRQRVKLTKAGREWKGLSPFNSERTPSFTVNDQKGFYHCFSSGNHGNIFDFVMATEGLSFPEAVERLAADAGLTLPEVSPQQAEHERKRASLHEVLELAAAIFEAELRGRSGAKARAYLAGRGLSPEIQERFRLGYASADKFALRDALAAKAVPVEMMIEAGVLISGDEIAVPYDRFRDRVMFPICDRSGRVIAFGGRALEKDAQAKYLNSPETPLFHKGAILYNHHNARKAAQERGTVVAVEGYVDVISLASVGIAHVVAPLGTALTAEQCELLWRMAEEPILCFDGDRAGRKAAYRAIDTVLPLIGPGRSLYFALLPDGQDPDDLARSGGAAAVEDVLGTARPLVDLLWQRETETLDFATPERRAGLERRLSAVCNEIRDETLRRYYAAELRSRLAALFEAARPNRAETRGAPTSARRRDPRGFRASDAAEPGYVSVPPRVGQSLAQSPLLRPSRPGIPGREAVILLLFINHPNLLEVHGEALAELDLSSSEAHALRTKLLDLWAQAAVSPGDLALELERCGLSQARQKLEAAKAHSTLWVLQPDAAESDAEETLKQALALHRKSRALHRELQVAKRALADESSEANLARLKDIHQQLSVLVGLEAAIEGFGTASGRPNRSL
ncbi:MAG: DNA primase [Beijerinckiaceae bacterium]